MTNENIPTVKRLLSDVEVEQEYGLRARTLRRWRFQSRKGSLPYVKLAGDTVKYDRREIERWLEASRVEPDWRREAEALRR